MITEKLRMGMNPRDFKGFDASIGALHDFWMILGYIFVGVEE